MAREEYVPPVGFAREPRAERRRWIGRIMLFLLVIFLAWLLKYGVLTPRDQPSRPVPQETLPAPV